LFWAQIRSDFPLTEAQIPLSPQIERFDGDHLFPQGPIVAFGAVDPDTARVWFLSQDQTDLIQVQNDRFIMNWRKITGEEIYPRYDSALRPRFEKDFNDFRRFINTQEKDVISVQQCEITYVNDIPRGEGWETLTEATSLFSPWWGKYTDGFLPAPEAVNVAGSFVMPNQQGRLHFATQNLRRTRDQREVVQLRLTARGKPLSSDTASVLDWMDLGREWIVRGFADLTSPKGHVLWKRTK
jgi:uncharacterized protein (TIGR04255 family)